MMHFLLFSRAYCLLIFHKAVCRYLHPSRPVPIPYLIASELVRSVAVICGRRLSRALLYLPWCRRGGRRLLSRYRRPGRCERGREGEGLVWVEELSDE